MAELLLILSEIIGPIFVMMLIGYVLQIKFKLDLPTLAKINIYFLAPGFIFNALYHAEWSGEVFGGVVLFFIVFVILLFIVARLFGRWLKMNKDKQTIFTNSAMFFNSGNYGVPVNDLVFQGDPYAMSIQVVALTFQNIFLFSYGIFSLRAAKKGALRAMLGYFRMPVLYGLLAGICLNIWQVELPELILIPANYIADAMIATALMTLGAQVAMIKFSSGMSTVYFSLIIRLIIGPLLALAIIYVVQLDGITAQALFIASAMPTSVNSAIIAQEYSDHSDFAAQIVLFSTLASAVTVTFVVYLARILF
ncbi:AEC family transporter [Amphibacillus cookii]|uniref:AEC family transporter n=1 Tax=Amphibacillus cookii TaxID=767787 RepID=UPI00195A92A6|nr:AEC family transporter [Amphibacillus cookii]MBM7542318.1 putative permease [Amphibacillus cookii]